MLVRFPCDKTLLHAVLGKQGRTFQSVCKDMYRCHSYIGQQLHDYGSLNEETAMFLQERYGIGPDDYAPGKEIVLSRPGGVYVTDISKDAAEHLAEAFYNALLRAKQEGVI